MSATILDGATLAHQLQETIRKRIQERSKHHLQPPGLAVILVGSDPASSIYVHHKHKACQKVGILSTVYHLPKHTSQQALLDKISTLNQDSHIHGILVQLPLPESINTSSVLDAIHPAKDVDGFHPDTIGRLIQRRPTLRPCTSYGIIKLLQQTQHDLTGAHAVVISASNLVGRPMALELLLQKCTVTVCHRFTQNLKNFVAQADILIVAAGKPHLIPGDWIKPQSIVIDVGINRLSNQRLVGDVDFDTARQRASWITPVPGGVGPMTITILLDNTLKAAIEQDNPKE